MLIDLAQNPVMDLTDDEKIDVVAKRVLERYRSAFEELLHRFNNTGTQY